MRPSRPIRRINRHVSTSNAPDKLCDRSRRLAAALLGGWRKVASVVLGVDRTSPRLLRTAILTGRGTRFIRAGNRETTGVSCPLRIGLFAIGQIAAGPLPSTPVDARSTGTAVCVLHRTTLTRVGERRASRAQELRTGAVPALEGVGTAVT